MQATIPLTIPPRYSRGPLPAIAVPQALPSPLIPAARATVNPERQWSAEDAAGNDQWVRSGRMLYIRSA